VELQSNLFPFGKYVCGVFYVAGICDAKMVIMSRPVLPYIEELNFMSGLGTSSLQESL
jgi:hypothetical protein